MTEDSDVETPVVESRARRDAHPGADVRSVCDDDHERASRDSVVVQVDLEAGGAETKCQAKHPEGGPPVAVIEHLGGLEDRHVETDRRGLEERMPADLPNVDSADFAPG